ncbi:MAG: glycine/sarcosine/betaine reductase component B subunit [Actinomycetota bacterium]|nr:glycine/sarcosine/betaine reductase component B subunit [Actinomycetota bacterium]
MTTSSDFDGLELAWHDVAEVGLGGATSFDEGRLTVSEQDASRCFDAPSLARTRFTWVSPGQSARLVNVLDVVQPRTKGRRGGGIFPGVLGRPVPQGSGTTHALRGAAVLTAGWMPRAQESVVQMSGEVVHLSFVAANHNLVVEFEPAEGAPWEEVDLALRRGLMRLAAVLAEASLDVDPDEVERLPALRGARDGQRPRVGTITNLQTQGAFKDVFVYGRSMSGSLPTVIDPAQLHDGAVVSGQYGHPGLKNCTYLYQSHPVVSVLRERDGKDLEFAGVILSPEPVDQTEKELVSGHAAHLAASLDMDAVIITKEGGGNADSDISLKMDACEALGISAVGIFGEMSGPDGVGPPLVSPPSNAKAMISTGNYYEVVTLQPVELALGGEVINLTGQSPTEEVRLPTAAIYGSLNPLGIGRLTCAEEVAR